MKRVTGIGGIFFKSKDPAATSSWYAKHLGIEIEDGGHNSSTFRWREDDDPEKKGATVWGVFPDTTTYFGEDGASFMINYRVENLADLLETLKKEGVTIARDIEDTPYGKFAWIVDPDGTRIELWEAPTDY